MSDVGRTCDVAPTGARDDRSHCITCGDDGVPMTVIRVDEDRMLALCEDGGGARSSVEIALVEPVGPGDTVLVHAGTAIL
jgi:hydrogenase expression/formation protein HypC